MKKKQLANIVMVALIVIMVAAGVLVAIVLRGENGSVNLGGTSATLTDAAGDKTCTIVIRCDSILSNLEALDPTKAPYVPESGYILTETTVSFTEGESVFDVLQRVCQEAGIQLEYSWSPLYDSYYVEGINHIYEFDCGPESGWMYMVNDQFPNYGSSDREVMAGDKIVWCYTCNGLGVDVGAKQE